MAAKKQAEKNKTVGIQVKPDAIGRAFMSGLQYSRAMLGYTGYSQTIREAVKRLAAELRGES